MRNYDFEKDDFAFIVCVSLFNWRVDGSMDATFMTVTVGPLSVSLWTGLWIKYVP